MTSSLELFVTLKPDDLSLQPPWSSSSHRQPSLLPASNPSEVLKTLYFHQILVYSMLGNLIGADLVDVRLPFFFLCHGDSCLMFILVLVVHHAWHSTWTWPRGDVPCLGLTNRDIRLNRIDRILIPTSCNFSFLETHLMELRV